MANAVVFNTLDLLNVSQCTLSVLFKIKIFQNVLKVAIQTMVIPKDGFAKVT